MKREDFFDWLCTVTKDSDASWEVLEDFSDGTIRVEFTNILEDEEEE
jgi:hypothetical protein